MIDTLAKNGVILNYKGVLCKEGKNMKNYVFYSVDEIEDLGTYGNILMNKNERVDERFCI